MLDGNFWGANWGLGEGGTFEWSVLVSLSCKVSFEQREFFEKHVPHQFLPKSTKARIQNQDIPLYLTEMKFSSPYTLHNSPETHQTTLQYHLSAISHSETTPKNSKHIPNPIIVGRS